MPQSYTEGQRLLGSDGQIYIVRGGVPTPEGGSTDVSRIVAPSPVRVAKEAQDRARQDEADARARRDQTSQEEKDRRAKLEWDATHNPDGTKKADATPDKLANIPAGGATGIQENLATLRKIQDAIAALDPTKGRPESVGPGTGALGQTFTNWHDPAGTSTRAAIGQVGAQKIHDLSGAAVSASEAPRFMPFVPTVTDPPEVALDKLRNFEKNLRQQIGEAANFYSPANGFRPYTTPGLAEVVSGKDVPNEATDKATVPYAGPGPVAPLNASGSTGQNVVGTGQNAVPNPEGEALYADYLKLWGANADDATIREWSKKIYGSVNPDVEAALQARREGKKINFYPGQGLLTKNVAADGGITGTIADTASTPLGTFGANFGNSAGAGIPQWLAGKASGNRDLTNIRFDTMNATNPNAAVTGQLAGGAAGAGAAELGALKAAMAFGRGAEWAPRIADTAYGATAGATGNPDNPGWGALVGGGLGFTGGAAGRRVASGIGNGFRGVQNELVRELADRGIPMTAGQIVGNSGRLGGAIKSIEDRLSGLPIIGDMVKARHTEGLVGLNRAAFDEGGSSIGAPSNGVIRAPGVEALDGSVQNAYSGALDGVNVTADAPFGADYGAAMRAGADLPEPMRGNAQYTLDTRVGNSFAPNGDLSGNNFQQSLRGLRRDTSSVASLPYGHDFGEVAGQAEDALTGLLNRQAPSVMPQYNAANQAFRLKEVLRDAVNRARNGSRSGETEVFTPSQLSDAAAANARKYGNTQGTRNQPFYNLTRAGQEVLPSKVPDSGTAGRLATLALPGVLGGAGAGYDKLSGDSGAGAAGLTLGALLAAGGTKRAQQLLQTILLDRPDAMIRIGNQINGRKELGGILGSSLLLEAQR